MAVTSIQVSPQLLKELKARKLHDRETYEEVIEDLLEDTLELNAETKTRIAEARAEYKAGKVISFEDIKKKHGL
jgi:predicted nucleic-acid-binding protein